MNNAQHESREETPVSEARRTLLELRLRGGFKRALQETTIVRHTHQGSVPLSFAQERLWFLDQLVPSNPFYNMPIALRLEGVLDVQALQKSLDALVVRHETLRTVFERSADTAVQVVRAPQSIDMPVVDLTRLPEPQRAVEARRLAVTEALRPFDLEHGPLIRGQLLRLDERDHVLLLSMHHIVSDGWSLGVLNSELAALYAAFRDGRPSSLPALPIQYTDFAVWQREWLTGRVLDQLLGYWKQQLANPAVLDLTADHSRPAMPTFRGAHEFLLLPKHLSEALGTLSQREGTTRFMTLLAAFVVLLHRYTSQVDITVGSPIASRNRPETEGLIGFFVNMLALRVDASQNPSFVELLARVRKVAWEAYDHQDLPFEKLVDELDPHRELSRNPLFQVALVLQNIPMPTHRLEGLALSSFPIEVQTTRLDLEVHLSEQPDGLHTLFIYSTDLFERATIRQMQRHFHALLESIVSEPNQRISQLPLMTERDRCQVIDQWNGTCSQYPREATIHELVEKQAAETPCAAAVVFEGQQLTYSQLNSRANQLAHHLRQQGVGLEVIVGICVERSLEMVIGILGILKAGGAYVPLDPSYPAHRLAFMINDTQTPLLLTQQHLANHLPEYGGRVICLDADWPTIAQQSDQNPLSGASAENLAYVIYTSGSTGTPKGVAVPHRAVNRLVLNTDYIALNSSDVVAQASNASFDAATFEVWGALLCGARLVIIDRETTLAPQAFAAALRQHGVTTLFVTTALFNQMAQEVPGVFAPLRSVLFGGEACDAKRVRSVLEIGLPQRLLHVYGPTENTSFSTWHLVQQVPHDATTVPIGRPIANTRVYVLDRYLNPVPTGVSGEMYLGGDGLARGYLNQAELTAEKFVPDPFNDQPGQRLYKAGDICRWLPDGTIEFQGRRDHQVKIRGFRVELGEVEATLSEHPAVSEVVATLREDEPGDRKLVAYVVSGDQQPSEWLPRLNTFAKDRLPTYMVPSHYVVLERLPLNANGKVDREALPAPDRMRGDELGKIAAPRSAMETKLAGIWAELLDLEEVGIHDNFFDLGGHSLLATQVINQIDLIFHVDFPLAELFQRPTVAQLAEAIDELLLAKIEATSEEEAQRLIAASRESP